MEEINIGDAVYCDFCNKDGQYSYGGVMIGSHAVCGHCCEENGYNDKNDDEITEFFSINNTFKENVLEYRKRTTGSMDGKIIIQRWDK